MRLRAELRQLGSSGVVPAAPVLSGTFVTPETALCLTAVFCAVNVISRDVAGMDRYVSRKLGDGGYDPIDDHPLNEILQIEPDDEHDGFRFFQQLMSHVLLRGNGYAEIVRDPSGYPQQLVPLHPTKTLPKRTKSGKLYYELENKSTLGPEDVIHLAGMGFDGIVGYSPITCARQSIGLGIAAEQYGAAYFGNSAVPKGVLQTPRRLSEPAVNNLRRSWNQVHQGSQSAGQVAILEEGVTWQSTQISPEDAQFLQTRKFQLEDVARLFGLPPNKIGEMSKAHLSNVEESNLDYLSTTLQGWLTMVERELNRKLLSRDDRKTLRITTDVTLTLRGNTAARTSYYQTLRNLGAISANDIRRREGMRPIDASHGGDLYLVQAQYQPLDQAGTPTTEKPVTPGMNGRSRMFGRVPVFSDGLDDDGDGIGSRLSYRFNPNHDPKTGQFAAGSGGSYVAGTGYLKTVGTHDTPGGFEPSSDNPMGYKRDPIPPAVSVSEATDKVFGANLVANATNLTESQRLKIGQYKERFQSDIQRANDVYANRLTKASEREAKAVAKVQSKYDAKEATYKATLSGSALETKLDRLGQSREQELLGRFVDHESTLKAISNKYFKYIGDRMFQYKQAIVNVAISKET